MILRLNKLHCGLMLELFTGSGAWAWWDGCVITRGIPPGQGIHVARSTYSCPHVQMLPTSLRHTLQSGLLLLFCHFTSMSSTHLGLCKLNACLVPPLCMPGPGAASAYCL